MLLLLAALSLVEAVRIKDTWPGARLMPAALGVVLLLLGAAHLRPARERQAPPEPAEPGGLARAATVFAAAAVHVAALPLLGFGLATGLFLAFLFRFLGSSWSATAALAIGGAVLCHLVFVRWLSMPFPAGLLSA